MSVIEILGWIIWGVAALFGVGFLMMRNKKEAWVQSALRQQGMILLAGVVITLLFPVSKFHLLWVAVLSFYGPMYLMKRKGQSVMKNAGKDFDKFLAEQKGKKSLQQRSKEHAQATVDGLNRLGRFSLQVEALSDDQLVDAFNDEVGQSGWTQSRAAYLHALRDEFGRRGFDCDAVNHDWGGTSWSKKIKLVDKKVELA